MIRVLGFIWDGFGECGRSIGLKRASGLVERHVARDRDGAQLETERTLGREAFLKESSFWAREIFKKAWQVMEGAKTLHA